MWIIYKKNHYIWNEDNLHCLYLFSIQFLKGLSTVTGKDVKTFIEQWAYLLQWLERLCFSSWIDHKIYHTFLFKICTFFLRIVHCFPNYFTSFFLRCRENILGYFFPTLIREELAVDMHDYSASCFANGLWLAVPRILYTIFTPPSESNCSFTLCRHQSGCARFLGSFVFNRKRNVVELELKQDYTAKGALKYVVRQTGNLGPSSQAKSSEIKRSLETNSAN